jgi:hypothetical protein
MMVIKKASKTGRPPGPGRPKGLANKSTVAAREAIARFVDGNAHRVQIWLDAIAETEGPLKAFQCYTDMIEYHVPKLSRTELTGKDEGPVQMVIKWKPTK